MESLSAKSKVSSSKVDAPKPVKKKSIVKEYSETLVIALLLALLIRTFCVQAFKIPSESMLDTLLVGDQLLATKFAYGIKIPFTHVFLYKADAPKRGDIIIFEFPEDPSMDFIKRVIGVPGDEIEVRNKQLYRNGTLVQEPYVRFTDTTTNMPKRDNFGPVTVPEDQFFVMGDNRDNSHDSRFWGFVKREAILAKAWRIYWSWGKDAFKDIRWSRLGMEIK